MVLVDIGLSSSFLCFVEAADKWDENKEFVISASELESGIQGLEWSTTSSAPNGLSEFYGVNIDLLKRAAYCIKYRQKKACILSLSEDVNHKTFKVVTPLIDDDIGQFLKKCEDSIHQSSKSSNELLPIDVRELWEAIHDEAFALLYLLDHFSNDHQASLLWRCYNSLNHAENGNADSRLDRFKRIFDLQHRILQCLCVSGKTTQASNDSLLHSLVDCRFAGIIGSSIATHSASSTYNLLRQPSIWTHLWSHMFVASVFLMQHYDMSLMSSDLSSAFFEELGGYHEFLEHNLIDLFHELELWRNSGDQLLLSGMMAEMDSGMYALQTCWPLIMIAAKHVSCLLMKCNVSETVRFGKFVKDFVANRLGIFSKIVSQMVLANRATTQDDNDKKSSSCQSVCEGILLKCVCDFAGNCDYFNLGGAFADYNQGIQIANASYVILSLIEDLLEQSWILLWSTEDLSQTDPRQLRLYQSIETFLNQAHHFLLEWLPFGLAHFIKLIALHFKIMHAHLGLNKASEWLLSILGVKIEVVSLPSLSSSRSSLSRSVAVASKSDLPDGFQAVMKSFNILSYNQIQNRTTAARLPDILTGFHHPPIAQRPFTVDFYPSPFEGGQCGFIPYGQREDNMLDGGGYRRETPGIIHKQTQNGLFVFRQTVQSNHPIQSLGLFFLSLCSTFILSELNNNRGTQISETFESQRRKNDISVNGPQLNQALQRCLVSLTYLLAEITSDTTSDGLILGVCEEMVEETGESCETRLEVIANVLALVYTLLCLGHVIGEIDKISDQFPQIEVTAFNILRAISSTKKTLEEHTCWVFFLQGLICGDSVCVSIATNSALGRFLQLPLIASAIPAFDLETLMKVLLVRKSNDHLTPVACRFEVISEFLTLISKSSSMAWHGKHPSWFLSGLIQEATVHHDSAILADALQTYLQETDSHQAPQPMLPAICDRFLHCILAPSFRIMKMITSWAVSNDCRLNTPVTGGILDFVENLLSHLVRSLRFSLEIFPSHLEGMAGFNINAFLMIMRVSVNFVLSDEVLSLLSMLISSGIVEEIVPEDDNYSPEYRIWSKIMNGGGGRVSVRSSSSSCSSSRRNSTEFQVESSSSVCLPSRLLSLLAEARGILAESGFMLQGSTDALGPDPMGLLSSRVPTTDDRELLVTVPEFLTVEKLSVFRLFDRHKMCANGTDDANIRLVRVIAFLADLEFVLEELKTVWTELENTDMEPHKAWGQISRLAELEKLSHFFADLKIRRGEVDEESNDSNICLSPYETMCAKLCASLNRKQLSDEDRYLYLIIAAIARLSKTLTSSGTTAPTAATTTVSVSSQSSAWTNLSRVFLHIELTLMRPDISSLSPQFLAAHGLYFTNVIQSMSQDSGWSGYYHECCCSLEMNVRRQRELMYVMAKHAVSSLMKFTEMNESRELLIGWIAGSLYQLMRLHAVRESIFCYILFEMGGGETRLIESFQVALVKVLELLLAAENDCAADLGFSSDAQQALLKVPLDLVSRFGQISKTRALVVRLTTSVVNSLKLRIPNVAVFHIFRPLVYLLCQRHAILGQSILTDTFIQKYQKTVSIVQRGLRTVQLFSEKRTASQIDNLQRDRPSEEHNNDLLLSCLPRFQLVAFNPRSILDDNVTLGFCLGRAMVRDAEEDKDEDGDNTYNLYQPGEGDATAVPTHNKEQQLSDVLLSKDEGEMALDAISPPEEFMNLISSRETRTATTSCRGISPQKTGKKETLNLRQWLLPHQYEDFERTVRAIPLAHSLVSACGTPARFPVSAFNDEPTESMEREFFKVCAQIITLAQSGLSPKTEGGDDWTAGMLCSTIQPDGPLNESDLAAVEGIVNYARSMLRVEDLVKSECRRLHYHFRCILGLKDLMEREQQQQQQRGTSSSESEDIVSSEILNEIRKQGLMIYNTGNLNYDSFVLPVINRFLSEMSISAQPLSRCRMLVSRQFVFAAPEEVIGRFTGGDNTTPATVAAAAAIHRAELHIIILSLFVLLPSLVAFERHLEITAQGQSSPLKLSTIGGQRILLSKKNTASTLKSVPPKETETSAAGLWKVPLYNILNSDWQMVDQPIVDPPSASSSRSSSYYYHQMAVEHDREWEGKRQGEGRRRQLGENQQFRDKWLVRLNRMNQIVFGEFDRDEIMRETSTLTTASVESICIALISAIRLILLTGKADDTAKTTSAPLLSLVGLVWRSFVYFEEEIGELQRQFPFLLNGYINEVRQRSVQCDFMSLSLLSCVMPEDYGICRLVCATLAGLTSDLMMTLTRDVRVNPERLPFDEGETAVAGGDVIGGDVTPMVDTQDFGRLRKAETKSRVLTELLVTFSKLPKITVKMGIEREHLLEYVMAQESLNETRRTALTTPMTVKEAHFAVYSYACSLTYLLTLVDSLCCCDHQMSDIFSRFLFAASVMSVVKTFHFPSHIKGGGDKASLINTQDKTTITDNVKSLGRSMQSVRQLEVWAFPPVYFVHHLTSTSISFELRAALMNHFRRDTAFENRPSSQLIVRSPPHLVYCHLLAVSSRCLRKSPASQAFSSEFAFIFDSIFHRSLWLADAIKDCRQIAIFEEVLLTSDLLSNFPDDLAPNDRIRLIAMLEVMLPNLSRLYEEVIDHNMITEKSATAPVSLQEELSGEGQIGRGDGGLRQSRVPSIFHQRNVFILLSIYHKALQGILVVRLMLMGEGLTERQSEVTVDMMIASLTILLRATLSMSNALMSVLEDIHHIDRPYLIGTVRNDEVVIPLDLSLRPLTLRTSADIRPLDQLISSILTFYKTTRQGGGGGGTTRHESGGGSFKSNTTVTKPITSEGSPRGHIITTSPQTTYRQISPRITRPVSSTEAASGGGGGMLLSARRGGSSIDQRSKSRRRSRLMSLSPGRLVSTKIKENNQIRDLVLCYNNLVETPVLGDLSGKYELVPRSILLRTLLQFIVGLCSGSLCVSTILLASMKIIQEVSESTTGSSSSSIGVSSTSSQIPSILGLVPRVLECIQRGRAMSSPNGSSRGASYTEEDFRRESATVSRLRVNSLSSAVMSLCETAYKVLDKVDTQGCISAATLTECEEIIKWIK